MFFKTRRICFFPSSANFQRFDIVLVFLTFCLSLKQKLQIDINLVLSTYIFYATLKEFATARDILPRQTSNKDRLDISNTPITFLFVGYKLLRVRILCTIYYFHPQIKVLQVCWRCSIYLCQTSNGGRCLEQAEKEGPAA